MRSSYVTIMAVMQAVATAAFATSAGATDINQADAMCQKRGAECRSFATGCDKNNQNCTGAVACVDNSSTGHGVQCVSCKNGQQCTVVREVPKTSKWQTIRGNVTGVMTNSPGTSTGPSTNATSLAAAISRASSSLGAPKSGSALTSTSNVKNLQPGAPMKPATPAAGINTLGKTNDSLTTQSKSLSSSSTTTLKKPDNTLMKR